MERRPTDIHDERIPAPARSECHDRVREVLLQDVGLGPFEVAADPRHGQLPSPEGGKDSREIGHDDRFVRIDVGKTRLPVVRVALRTKIHAGGIGFVFKRPGTH
jgi:hypothetical protein